MSHIHGLYFRGIAVVDDGAAYLQGVGQFAGFHGELAWQKGELLDFLESGKTLLECVEALLYQSPDVGILDEVFNVAILYFLFPGIFLDGLESGNDNGRHIFALVADDGHLFDIRVFAEAAFDCLRGDVLAVGGLE